MCPRMNIIDYKSKLQENFFYHMSVLYGHCTYMIPTHINVLLCISFGINCTLV